MAEKNICKVSVIHCIDYRIQGDLNTYLEERFPGVYDRISVAGGIKKLPIEQCQTSMDLHHPETFVLIQHEDCGAYGGSEALGDFEAEQKFQGEEMVKAELKLREHFPDTSVEKFLIRLSGEMKSL